MRFVNCALVFALAACGRVKFEDRAIAGDSAIDGLDHGCDLAAPFGSPEPITELNDPADIEGTLRLLPDELSGYYWSQRDGLQSIIRHVTRASLDEPFAIEDIDLTDVGNNEVDPAISPDGALLVFRASGPGDLLYGAAAITPTSFSAPTKLTVLDGGSASSQPFFVSRTELFYASKLTGNGDLYRSTVDGLKFGAPSIIAELATSSGEGDPATSADGLTLYFRTTRAPSVGGFDIFVATRPDLTSPFGAATPVENVNSAADDGPSWLSSDGCRMYISSDRAGTNDVYVARRGHLP